MSVPAELTCKLQHVALVKGGKRLTGSDTVENREHNEHGIVSFTHPCYVHGFTENRPDRYLLQGKKELV